MRKEGTENEIDPRTALEANIVSGLSSLFNQVDQKPTLRSNVESKGFDLSTGREGGYNRDNPYTDRMLLSGESHSLVMEKKGHGNRPIRLMFSLHQGHDREGKVFLDTQDWPYERPSNGSPLSLLPLLLVFHTSIEKTLAYPSGDFSALLPYLFESNDPNPSRLDRFLKPLSSSKASNLSPEAFAGRSLVLAFEISSQLGRLRSDAIELEHGKKVMVQNADAQHRIALERGEDTFVWTYDDLKDSRRIVLDLTWNGQKLFELRDGRIHTHISFEDHLNLIAVMDGVVQSLGVLPSPRSSDVVNRTSPSGLSEALNKLR